MISYIFSKSYLKAILLLVQTSIAKQNKNTIFGSLWGLIQPFTHIIIISYFFGFLLRQNLATMVENLVGALAFWNFITISLNQACHSLTTRGDIIKRAIISKTYFPISDVVSHVYTLAYSFIAMYLALIIFYPNKFYFTIMLIPFFTIPLIICVITSGIALSFLTPYIRDIPQLVNLLLSVIYWTVPIIYPYTLIPENKRILFEYNPVYVVIKPMQDLVVTGNLPSVIVIVKSWIVAMIITIISFLIYKKLSPKVVFYL